MKFSELASLIDEFYPEVLDERGEVFFGSKRSLLYPNGVAIVGLNPGGDGLPTVRENITNYENCSQRDSFSGYLDQCWHEPFFSRVEACPRCRTALAQNGLIHQNRHQKMVSLIADGIGVDLRQTIALNAIWIQTKNAPELRKYLKKTGQKNMEHLFSKKAFPVFKGIFLRCRVKLVICLGNGSSDSSFELFRRATHTPRESIVCTSTNYRDGRYFQCFIDGAQIMFFGVAHPSLHTTSPLGINVLKRKWDEISRYGVGAV